tara:strand:- start:596 stop:907 length:312 start_codon:yes stop_codon:yes gene_type:complete
VLKERPYASALVLAEEETDTSASDSRALTTLLLVRDIRRVMASEAAARDPGGAPLAEMTLLGEILDSETRDLVAAAGVCAWSESPSWQGHGWPAALLRLHLKA